ncbi:MAG TPA: glycoside hydrolase family 3 N-terminal domain-containing protein [Marmoricola sp.]|nr:glycoside hydrolase family 3 N-terminal domain-containing protein [Marmoricola sp.]
MSLDRLALRVLLPSFPGAVLDDEVCGLLEEGLGGLCLFGSNTADGPEAVAAYADRARRAAPDLVMAIDEEGGDVTRLHAASGSPFLGAGALGAADDLDLTRATAAAIGAELAGLGLDLTLGPVADVNSNPDNPVIGIRSFGTEPDRVAAHVAAWVDGVQAAGTAACAKHFPGHGDTRQDSHLELPEIDVPLDLLRARELVPFRAAVRAGVEAVMTSHIVVRALDGLPATLSAPVLSMLRADLGFSGLIVSDALDMAGASAGRGIPRSAVESLVAGIDLLCIGPDKDVALVRAIQRAIVEGVRSGELAEDRLAQAAARVDRFGVRRRSVPEAPPDDLRSRQYDGARAALRIEGALPDLHGASVVSVATEPNIAVGSVPWGVSAELTVAPDGSVPPGSGPVLVQVREAHRHPDVLDLLQRTAVGRAVVVLEWGWPGALPGPLSELPRVVPFGSSQPSVAAVAALLHDAGWEAPS